MNKRNGRELARLEMLPKGVAAFPAGGLPLLCKDGANKS